MPRGQLQETKLIARAWWRLAQPAAEGVRPPPEIASRHCRRRPDRCRKN